MGGRRAVGRRVRAADAVAFRRILRRAYVWAEGSRAHRLVTCGPVQLLRARVTRTSTSADDVVAILAELDRARVKTCLIGGWALDALLEDQTREHADVDIVVALDDLGPAVRCLKARGFTVYKRHHAAMFDHVVDLVDGGRCRASLHGARSDLGPGGWVRILPEETDRLGETAAVQFATGSVGGHEVRCASAPILLALHTGYRPAAEDFHDVTLLCERFGLPVPAEYAPTAAAAR